MEVKPVYDLTGRNRLIGCRVIIGNIVATVFCDGRFWTWDTSTNLSSNRLAEGVTDDNINAWFESLELERAIENQTFKPKRITKTL